MCWSPPGARSRPFRPGPPSRDSVAPRPIRSACRPCRCRPSPAPPARGPADTAPRRGRAGRGTPATAGRCTAPRRAPRWRRRSSPDRASRPGRPPPPWPPSRTPVRPARAPRPRTCGAGSRKAWREYRADRRSGGPAVRGEVRNICPPVRPSARPPPSGLREQLLEQGERPGILGLAKPENRLAPELRVAVRARDADQGGNPLVAGPLGQREHGAFFHLDGDARVVHQVGESTRRRVARGLAEPEHGGAPRLVGNGCIAGEAEQVRPDRDAVREDGGEDGSAADRRGGARGEVQEVAGCHHARDRAEVCDVRALAVAPLAAHVGPQAGDLATAQLERYAGRPGFAGTTAAVLVVPVERARAAAAVAVVAFERDDAAAVAAHAGPSGVAEAHLAVGRSAHAISEASLEDGKGEGEGKRENEGQRPDHWLMISSRTCAARGSCDWPSQKIAFLRRSFSCSVRAILIRASSAWDSWRCEYTKISCSFISGLRIRSYSAVS